MSLPTFRRDFLAHSAAAVAACSTLAAADDPKSTKRTPTIIDTHVHFYDPTRPQGVPWPGKGDKRLYRKILPADYRKLSDALGVTGTVVVEASPWPEDNHWLLKLAADDPFLVGIVGNLRPGSDDFTREWPKLVKDPKFRGIRVNGGELAKNFDDAAWRRDLKRMVDDGRTLDVNGGPEHVAVTAKLAAELPRLTIVINHIGGVAVDGKAPPLEWVRHIEAVAKCPHVFCKVSALVEYAAPRGKPIPEDWQAPRDVAFYQPVLEVLWKEFGGDRLVYGSNWPVSERYAPLMVVQKLATDWISEKGEGAKTAFFAKNAELAYRWTTAK